MNFILAAFVLLLLAFGILTGSEVTNSAVQGTMSQNVINPTDPTTWPQGDKLWDCCRAIAYAEGYNVAGSVPARLNNPGDLSDGMNVYGSEFHSGSNVTTFPNASVGWQWLYDKLHNIVVGNSSVYDASMSWYEIGQQWAQPNWQVWGDNVASRLGVDPNSSLADYVNS